MVISEAAMERVMKILGHLPDEKNGGVGMVRRDRTLPMVMW